MKKERYEGHMDHIDSYNIYLNVNRLKNGHYQLKIINKNKIIKSTHFIKE